VKTMGQELGITVLGSGSAGNATLIHCGKDAILIDAGFSFKEFSRRLALAGMDELDIHGILVTHEHDDHVRGLRVCAQKLEIPVYATRQCAEFIRHHDAKMGQMATFTAGGNFNIGCFEISPFSVPHDAKDPVAFAIYCEGCKMAVATDIGYVSSVVEYKLRECDAMVLESNHDMNMLAASQRAWSVKQRIMGRYGHLSNDSSEQLLESIISPNTKDIILGHISHECNTPEKAKEAAIQALSHIGRTDIHLHVAQQDQPIETVWVK